MRLLLTFLVFSLGCFGQGLQCETTQPVTPTVRGEGYAESVGDIVIRCIGGVVNFTVTVDFTVTSDTWITSRLVPGTNLSEAVLLVGDPAAPAIPGTNLFQGEVSNNQAVFRSVHFPIPGQSNLLTMRIKNLRVKAVDHAGGAVSLLVTASNGLLVANLPTPSATIAQGATFALLNPAGDALPSFSFSAGAGGAITHQLKFTEGFASSFKKRNTATTPAAPTAIADQNLPATDYQTESLYYDSGLPNTASLNTAGLATQGTRLVARFTGVPAGVSLYVSTAALPGTSATARLIAADASGAGPYSAVAQTATATAGGASVGIAPITVANGIATATWEVLDANPVALDSLTFGAVVVAGQSGVANVTGSLGPVSVAATADDVSPVPRFASTWADLVVSPTSISATYTTGGALPAPVTLQVTTGAAQAFSVAVSGIPAGLISVSPMNGTTPGPVQVTIHPANLYPNTYHGSVLITSGYQTREIPVDLTVYPGDGGLVAPGVVPELGTVSPTGSAGANQTFTATYTAANGYHDLRWVQMLFATAADGGGQSYCFVHYDVQGNSFWLYGDGGFFVGPVTPGTPSNRLQNSLCALNTSDSTVSALGTVLTVNANLTFKQGAARNIYMRAMNLGNLDTGWTQRGTWTASAAAFGTPAVSPASGSGSTQTFTVTYPDPPGFSGAPFGWAQFLVAAASDGGGQPFCFVHYDRGGNGLWLYSSDAGFFLGPVSPGTTSNALSSSACSVNTASAHVTNTGGNLVLTVPITMKSPMSGAKKLFQRTLDTLNRDTGWQQTGTWTVQ